MTHLHRCGACCDVHLCEHDDCAILDGTEITVYGVKFPSGAHVDGDDCPMCAEERAAAPLVVLRRWDGPVDILGDINNAIVTTLSAENAAQIERIVYEWSRTCAALSLPDHKP